MRIDAGGPERQPGPSGSAPPGLSRCDRSPHVEGEGFKAKPFNVNNPIMTPRGASSSHSGESTTQTCPRRNGGKRQKRLLRWCAHLQPSGINSDLFNVASDVLEAFSGSSTARHSVKGRASNALFPREPALISIQTKSSVLQE